MAVRLQNSSDAFSRTTSLPTSAATLMAWIYLSVNRTATVNFLALGDSTGSTYVQLAADQNIGDGQLFIWDGNSTVTGTTLSLNTWYHLTLVIPVLPGDDAGDCLGYLNGTLDITCPDIAALVSSEKLWVGNDNDNEFLDGRVAAVKVWNAVLSASEIQQEMRQYLPVRTANLNGFYPILSVADDETDYSGNGNTFTVGGTPETEDGPPIPWKMGKRRVIFPTSVASNPPTLQGILRRSMFKSFVKGK